MVSGYRCASISNMAFAKTYSAQTDYLQASIITLEIDLGKGLHSFSIVGLPDKGVEESRDRISAAIKNSGFKSPKNKNQKVVVSLAPADIKKEGPAFDLGMALAYLLASEDIKFDPKDKIFLGELSLDGKVRPVTGTLACVIEAKKNGFKEIYVASENAREAALIEGVDVYAVKNLSEVIAHLIPKDIVAEHERGTPNLKKKLLQKEPRTVIVPDRTNLGVDFSDIKGQDSAKRGLEIGAAGGHNMAMSGPPGTGKTMLAKAFSTILPDLSFDHILEATSIHSVAGILKNNLVTAPPLRAPHHTASYVAVTGGGATPKPGEITLAHRGILFLDEFPEFDRRVIETLREPLEERKVSVSRAKGSVSFPAHFILIAAMNPCPCGNYNVKNKVCTCSAGNLSKYQRKLSGPIIDRIDIWLEVGQISHDKLSEKEAGESSDKIRDRVIRAREIQAKRFASEKFKTNSEMSARDIEKYVVLDPETKKILNASAKNLDLSARSYHRLIKLARTIADLHDSEQITQKHVLEALQYRPKKIL